MKTRDRCQFLGQPKRNYALGLDVLIDLGARLGLPGFINDDFSPKFPNGYIDYIVNHERQPGIGPLAGWRGNGESFGKGKINPNQIDEYMSLAREKEANWMLQKKIMTVVKMLKICIAQCAQRK